MLVVYFFFFFKQKTAYEIGVRLVGSEMCIRDRYTPFDSKGGLGGFYRVFGEKYQEILDEMNEELVA